MRILVEMNGKKVWRDVYFKKESHGLKSMWTWHKGRGWKVVNGVVKK